MAGRNLKDLADSVACPCGSGVRYADCCGRLHAGENAASALELMRARYSAYVLALEDYLLDSWHASTRPAALADLGAAGEKWLGLKIIADEQPTADLACVEFVARYRRGGAPAVRMRERSLFLREGGRWYYLRAED